jgi:putative protein-disulfide isomerase
MKLILVADPLCSWCYGFGKEMSTLLERRPEIALELVMGGLTAQAAGVLNEDGKRFRLGHWEKVERAAGVPFNRTGLMDRVGFVYNSEAICRAVVAARIVAPDGDLLEVFRALQRAFYVDALDTGDEDVLAAAAAAALQRQGRAVTPAEILHVWSSARAIEATQADFSRTRALGVISFPTLFKETGLGLSRIGNGYASADELERELFALPKQA